MEEHPHGRGWGLTAKGGGSGKGRAQRLCRKRLEDCVSTSTAVVSGNRGLFVFTSA